MTISLVAMMMSSLVLQSQHHDGQHIDRHISPLRPLTDVTALTKNRQCPVIALEKYEIISLIDLDKSI